MSEEFVAWVEDAFEVRRRRIRFLPGRTRGPQAALVEEVPPRDAQDDPDRAY